MRMTSHELKELLKRQTVAARNPELSSPYYPPWSVAVVEPTPEYVNVAAPRLQKASRQSFRVRVVSVRNRLIDEDNLSCKYVVDQLRYAGLIPNDDAATTKIEVSQRKCEEGEPEHVRITIEKL